MIGLLIYLPTISYVPHAVYLLTAVYLIIKHRNQIAIRVQKFIEDKKINLPANLLLILLVIALSLINRILFIKNLDSIGDLIPYFVLILLSYFIAKNISRRSILIVIYLILLECIVLFMEYYSGVSTFYKNLDTYYVFGDTKLFYYTHSMGLSYSSSIIAAKILIAYLLIDYLMLKGYQVYVMRLILITAMFMTFNRTGMVSLALYIGFQYLSFLAPLKWRYDRILMYMFMTIMGLFGLGVLSYQFSDVIISQFTRDHGEVDLSGRSEIWEFYIDFIKHNIIFGNGSYKLWDGDNHAHNSYLQLISTNGLVISAIYFYLIILNVFRRNFLLLFIIFVFSSFQYGIFWGISLMDITLFLFLFRPADSLDKKGLFRFDLQPLFNRAGSNLLMSR